MFGRSAACEPWPSAAAGAASRAVAATVVMIRFTLASFVRMTFRYIYGRSVPTG